MAYVKLDNLDGENLNHVLNIQRDLKKKKKVQQFGLEQTIYQIIREHKQLTEKK